MLHKPPCRYAKRDTLALYLGRLTLFFLMAGVIASLLRHPMNMLKRSKDPYLPNLFFISQILGKDHAVAYYSYVDELPSLDAELYKVS